MIKKTIRCNSEEDMINATLKFLDESEVKEGK